MPPQDPFGPDSEYLSPQPARRSDVATGTKPNRPRRRWSLLLLAVVVLLVEAAIVLVNHGIAAGPRPDAGPTTPSPATPVPTVAGTTEAAPVYGPPIWVTTDLSWVPPAGLTGRWDLLARGPGVIVRLSPATGMVSRVGIPQLSSSGPVSFIATANSSLVRPLDRVPGYVVPDGGPARPMPASLAADGPMLPGPDPAHVWVLSSDDAHSGLVLKPVDGGPVTSLLPVPEGASPIGAIPDGAGYALFATDHGLVDVRPTGSRVVSRGTLLAVGPTTLLASECDVRAVCTLIAIDQRSGTRRAVGAAQSTWASGGVVSPDGRTAALATLGVGGRADLVLVDLTSAIARVLPLEVSSGPGGTIAWSPDSQWVFAVLGHTGGLAVVDAATGSVRDIGVQLPPLVQLAIHPAP